MGAIGEIGERAGRRVQELVGMGERLGSLQRRVDDRLKRSLERFTNYPAVQKEMQRIERTIRVLEERISRLRAPDDTRSTDGANHDEKAGPH
jgi:hypothetical protein